MPLHSLVPFIFFNPEYILSFASFSYPSFNHQFVLLPMLEGSSRFATFVHILSFITIAIVFVHLEVSSTCKQQLMLCNRLVTLKFWVKVMRQCISSRSGLRNRWCIVVSCRHYQQQRKKCDFEVNFVTLNQSSLYKILLLNQALFYTLPKSKKNLSMMICVRYFIHASGLVFIALRTNLTQIIVWIKPLTKCDCFVDEVHHMHW